MLPGRILVPASAAALHITSALFSPVRCDSTQRGNVHSAPILPREEILERARLKGELDATKLAMAELSTKLREAVAVGKRAVFVSDVQDYMLSSEGPISDALLIAECSRLLPIAVSRSFGVEVETASFGKSMMSKLCYGLYSLSEGAHVPREVADSGKKTALRHNLRQLHKASLAVHRGDLLEAVASIDGLVGEPALLFEEWLEMADTSDLIKANLTALRAKIVRDVESLESEAS